MDIAGGAQNGDLAMYGWMIVGAASSPPNRSINLQLRK
jgi:hypothetical protein